MLATTLAMTRAVMAKFRDTGYPRVSIAKVFELVAEAKFNYSFSHLLKPFN